MSNVTLGCLFSQASTLAWNQSFALLSAAWGDCPVLASQVMRVGAASSALAAHAVEIIAATSDAARTACLTFINSSLVFPHASNSRAGRRQLFQLVAITPAVEARLSIFSCKEYCDSVRSLRR